MKIKGSISALLIALGGLIYSPVMRAGQTSLQLQQLHRDIGSCLIDIRKNYPPLQQTVYSLLDQVGSLHRLSSKMIQKRKSLKQAMNEERSMRVSLQKDNEKLNTALRDMKQSVSQENSRMAFYQQQCEDLNKERAELLHKKVEADSKERDYHARIKELEKSLQKSSQPSGNLALAAEKPHGRAEGAKAPAAPLEA